MADEYRCLHSLAGVNLGSTKMSNFEAQIQIWPPEGRPKVSGEDQYTYLPALFTQPCRFISQFNTLYCMQHEQEQYFQITMVPQHFRPRMACQAQMDSWSASQDPRKLSPKRPSIFHLNADSGKGTMPAKLSSTAPPGANTRKRRNSACVKIAACQTTE